MTTISTTAQRDGLVGLLQGLTTSGGQTFLVVDREMPTMAPSPGAVQAWCQLLGYTSERRPSGFHGQTLIHWRWRVALAIWWTNDPTQNAATEDDFTAAVTTLFQTHMRAGVSFETTGIVIERVEIDRCTTDLLDADSTFFKLVQFDLTLVELAQVALAD